MKKLVKLTAQTLRGRLRKLALLFKVVLFDHVASIQL